MREKLANGEYVSPTYVAEQPALAGLRAEALRYLEKAYAMRTWFIWSKIRRLMGCGRNRRSERIAVCMRFKGRLHGEIKKGHGPPCPLKFRLI
jgi:hypothetical protein